MNHSGSDHRNSKRFDIFHAIRRVPGTAIKNQQKNQPQEALWCETDEISSATLRCVCQKSGFDPQVTVDN